MIVVLGGGPAGRIASIRLATAGKKVTLVESGGKSGGIGGQCLHFGCMPVCALNDVARIISSARRFYERGMTDVVPAPPVFEGNGRDVCRPAENRRHP